MNKFWMTLAAFIFLMTGACAEDNEAEESSKNPVEGALVFSSATATSVSVSWPEATSSVSPASQLQYQLVYSTSSIQSLESAQAATVAMAYTAATLTSVVTGLTSSTTYHFAVLVKDTEGNIGYSTSPATTLCSGKIMYVVLNAAKGGALGGSAGADTICNNNKPTGFSSATFKALISDNNRRACYTSGDDSCSPSSTTGRLNWVFTANTDYCKADYTGLIGKSTAAAYLAPNIGILSSTSTDFFSGMNMSWGQSTGNNCSNWTNTAGVNPVIGDASKGGLGFIIAGSNLNCNTVSNLVCVEQ